MPDPQVYEHIRRTKTVLRVRLLADGDPLNLSGYTVRAGLQSSKSTASTTAAFRRFVVTSHGSTGTLSATIPPTGIGWTGQSTLRFWNSASPLQFLGGPIAVRVEEIGTNFVP